MMMRRNKKASLPEVPVNSPAVRRSRAAAASSSARLESVAYPSSSSSLLLGRGSSTSDTTWRGDPFPLLTEGKKAAPWRRAEAEAAEAARRPCLVDPRSAQTAAPPLPHHLLSPPLPHHHPPPACAEGGRHGARADIMFNIFHSIPTQMDYKGQKLAEQIFQGIILFSAAVGFVYGYITEQFGWTVYIVMAGFALSCLLTLPPWPIYRRNPLKWLPAQESTIEDKKPTDRKVKRHPKN